MTDWTILGGNPAPGSPDVFEAVAQALGPIVGAAQSSSESLRTIAQYAGSPLWSGSAAAAFAESVHVLPMDLGELVAAHQAAISALNDYAGTLSCLQLQAAQALAAAQSAQSDAESASASRSAATARYSQAEQRYWSYRGEIDVLEMEKSAAGAVGDQTASTRLELEIASATEACNAAWTEQSIAAVDIRAAQSALDSAQTQFGDAMASARRIAADRLEAAESLVGRLGVAAEFGVARRSWIDRVRHDFDSIAGFNWRRIAERALTGTGTDFLREMRGIDSFARAHAAEVRTVADVINHYATDVSTIAARAAPWFAAVGLFVESVSLALPPPADAAAFVIGKEVASVPAEVSVGADLVRVASVGAALGADELAEISASQRVAQIEADGSLVETSTVDLGFDAANWAIAGGLPPLEDVPAQLAEGGATDTVRAVVNYDVQNYVIPKAESDVQNLVAP